MSIRILATGSYVPERILSNADLEKMVDTSDEWIRTRTGIQYRHLGEPEQASSDLGTKAAERALQKAGLTGKDLDAILVATVTPDHAFPSTACVVQKNIGAAGALCFDMAAACSGLIFALQTGYSLIKATPSIYRRVLVIGAEMPTRMVDWTNRNTCVLFGDGAGAVILGLDEADNGPDFLVASDLHTDGTYGDLLKLPAGGSRMPATAETVANKMHYMHMEGREVFKNAVAGMVGSSRATLERAGVAVSDVRWVIPHQANIRIIDAVSSRLGASTEQLYTNIDRMGNTSAASIGICLDELANDGKLASGDQVLITAFGGGLTWGAMLIRW